MIKYRAAELKLLSCLHHAHFAGRLELPDFLEQYGASQPLLLQQESLFAELLPHTEL